MKSVYLDAEMFGKASYFTALDAREPCLTGICISASAFQGTNITATSGQYISIFNDPCCNATNIPNPSNQENLNIKWSVNIRPTNYQIRIDCVYDEHNKLTQFIKDCRNKTVLRKHKRFTLKFLKLRCHIEFNKKKYSFKYYSDYPNINHLLSQINISQKKGFLYQPKYLKLIRHLDLLWHKKTHPDAVVIANCTNGWLLAIKPGAILIICPLESGMKKMSLGKFVRGTAKTDAANNDLFEKSLQKKLYKEEFGNLLADELLVKKA